MYSSYNQFTLFCFKGFLFLLMALRNIFQKAVPVSIICFVGILDFIFSLNCCCFAVWKLWFKKSKVSLPTVGLTLFWQWQTKALRLFLKVLGLGARSQLEYPKRGYITKVSFLKSVILLSTYLYPDVKRQIL